MTSLPPLSPSSCLKKLDTSGCNIQSLPHNLFHHKLEKIDLEGNKGDYDDNDDHDDDKDDDMTKMMMMIMIMSQKPAFTHFPLSWYSGLTSLPLLSPSSCLKKLNAEECNIQSLPHNLFHYKLEELNLFLNKGKDDDYNDDEYGFSFDLGSGNADHKL